MPLCVQPVYSVCLVLGLQLSQPLHEAALTARGIIAVQNALGYGLIKLADRFARSLDSIVHIAAIQRDARLLDLVARARTNDAVTLTFFLGAANALESRLMISHQ